MLPRFQINLFDGTKFAYSLNEFEALKQDEEEYQKKRHLETLASIPADERTAEMEIYQPSRLHFLELYEEDSLNTLLDQLRKFGFELSNYLISDGALIEILEDEDKVKEFHTLREVVDFLRANGRKGIEIQRYKGLAEMNPDQLWETTMDPEKRTLIKVLVRDMVAADITFTMLMGEEVPPRRAFIEQHALSVKNLDI